MNIQHEKFQANSLEHYWMPFTANRQFKKSPRLFVSAEGIRTDDDLAAWTGRGIAYAASLPPK